MADKTLRSYRVVDKNGQPTMVIIVPSSWKLAEINKLLQNGMNVTVIDHRSDLVRKEIVD